MKKTLCLFLSVLLTTLPCRRADAFFGITPDTNSGLLSAILAELKQSNISKLTQLLALVNNAKASLNTLVEYGQMAASVSTLVRNPDQWLEYELSALSRSFSDVEEVRRRIVRLDSLMEQAKEGDFDPQAYNALLSRVIRERKDAFFVATRAGDSYGIWEQSEAEHSALIEAARRSATLAASTERHAATGMLSQRAASALTAQTSAEVAKATSNIALHTHETANILREQYVRDRKSAEAAAAARKKSMSGGRYFTPQAFTLNPVQKVQR